ncbi:U6 snRNA phosphodiesterase 1-like [Oscarella lobularis]|uniref:U6 snRNA phosphodiesterase 1-like n=1 Tax=Oscarella lobularis TaxID=121494 RepID=UPI003313D562
MAVSEVIVDYSSSEDNETDDANNIDYEPSRKRVKGRRSRKYCSYSSEESFPVPDSILAMHGDDDAMDSEDRSRHDGRVRSFPHVAGNWPTHVYAQFSSNATFGSLISALTDRLQRFISMCRLPANFSTVNLIPSRELHVSVSKTVTIRHHWIQPLVDALHMQLNAKRSFSCTFGSIRVYCNEEKTRSFLGLKILAGCEDLVAVSNLVDTAFDEFNLEHFYKEMDFHLSVAWWLGNILPSLTPEIQQSLEDCFDEFMTSHTMEFEINEIICKTGNKYFTFSLPRDGN